MKVQNLTITELMIYQEYIERLEGDVPNNFLDTKLDIIEQEILNRIDSIEE